METSWPFITLWILFFGVVHIEAQSDHKLQLFDGPSSAGSWVSIDNYVSNLQSVAFNDLASSLCVVRGIWLLYEQPDYNTNSPGASSFYWGENLCKELPASLNNLVSSVRYGGSPFNFMDDGLNLYQKEWFQANEVYASGDTPNLASYNSGSLIVTGRNTWTLFDSPNYTGYRVCVTPSDMTSAYPGFFTTADEFGFSGRVVRSVKKGCWSKNRSLSPAKLTEPGKVYSSFADQKNV